MTLNIYSSKQEENIYIRRQAGTWKRSGLISEDSWRAVQDHTGHPLRQTNLFFRILFFIFTLLCAGALAGLFVWLMDKMGDAMIAVMLMVFGMAYYIAAEYLVDKHRLYRYGIEEALLLVSMFLFVISFLVFTDDYHFSHQFIAVILCLLFFVMAFWIYLRFGYLYMALISFVALGVMPFQFSMSPVAERLGLLFVLCGILFFNLISDKPDIEGFRKDSYITIQAFLLAAIYLTINLQILGLAGLLLRETPNIHLDPKLFPPYVYWSSYILTFILPAGGIYWGIRSRKRLILNASLVMACATLATNKSYLGMTRYAWDPAILGMALIALSLLITRWLNHGPQKARNGFTALSILTPEDHGISLADAATALTPGAIDSGLPQTPQDPYSEGGRSGGGGASRNF